MSRWISVHVRNVKPGDVVRVRKDAYSGSTGEMHNGRICEVVEIKGGDIIVKSIDDRHPILSTTHHSPTALEKEIYSETIN